MLIFMYTLAAQVLVVYNNLYFLGNAIECSQKTNDKSKYRQILLASL